MPAIADEVSAAGGGVGVVASADGCVADGGQHQDFAGCCGQVGPVLSFRSWVQAERSVEDGLAAGLHGDGGAGEADLGSGDIFGLELADRCRDEAASLA